MIQLKRDSPSPAECASEAKKLKGNVELPVTETADIENSTSIDGKSTSANSTNDPSSCSTTTTHENNQREKDLRRERGEMLLKLFREHPQLTDTATARKAEKNLERAQLWEEITRQINDAFSCRLETLSVEKTKKLLTYYKKKDDGSYDKIKAHNQSSFDEYQTDGDFDSTDPPSRCESVVSEHGGFEGDASTTAHATVSTEAEQHLRRFIVSLGSSSCDLSAAKSESPPSTILPDTAYNLKKERHDFVVATADHYLERMCFDSSSRSAQVNAERHNMWVKITHLTNEKYGSLLNPLGVEQTKKLFSNCKRRRRLRVDKGGEDWPLLPLSSTTESVSSEPDSAATNNTSSVASTLDSFIARDDSSSGHHLQYLMHGLDLSVEIRELRRQLAESEAEVARLQRIIVEQANDYRSRISSLVDFFKAAADKKVAEDIRSYLGVT
ncbi:hypothetical protein RB195_012137 [Necator americanus]